MFKMRLILHLLLLVTIAVSKAEPRNRPNGKRSQGIERAFPLLTARRQAMQADVGKREVSPVRPTVQYTPRNMHAVLLCFALLWLCNRS